MSIYSLFRLQWKSFIRHPLLEQNIFVGLLLGINVLGLLFFFFFIGKYISQHVYIIPSDKIELIKYFVFLLLILSLLDFLIKCFFKKRNNSLITLRRFPNGNRTVMFYSVIKELLSCWNFYLLIFLLPFLINLHLYNGLLITLFVVFSTYSIQLSISALVNKIKSFNLYIAPKLLFSDTLLSSNLVINYLSLNIKMIIRSPRLRQEFLKCILAIAALIYFYFMRDNSAVPFFAQIYLTSLFFIVFPFFFSGLLFSAESSFFDHLIISPVFKKILSAKYSMFVLFSSISFLLLSVFTPFSWESFFEYIAIFLYCVGFITLLSFCSILFVNTKVDLFGSYFKMSAHGQSLQAFATFLIYAFSLILTLIIYWLFSAKTAMYYMFIVGGLSILFYKSWFCYLYRCFNLTKYEKMELFRMP